MQKAFTIISFILLVLNYSIFAQKSRIDSIKREIQKANTNTIQIDLHTELAKTYRRSNTDSAIIYANKGIQLAQNIKDTIRLSLLYNQLGNIYKNRSDFEKAIQYHLQALDLRKKINHQKGIAQSLNNIGVTNFVQNNFDLAMDYYFQSLKIKELLKDTLAMSYSYNNIATVYNIQKKYNKALEYFSKSLIIKKKYNDISGQSFCYSNIANSYRELGEYSLASQNYKKALIIKQNIDDAYGISKVLYNTGKLQLLIAEKQKGILKNQTINKAIANFVESNKLAKKYNFLNNQIAAIKHLSNAYEQKGEYKIALITLKKHILLKDSLFNIEKLSDVRSLEIKYEAAQQNLEIEKLKRKDLKRTKELEELTILKKRLTSILVLFITVIVIIIVYYQKIKKKNFTINKQHKTINNQYEEIKSQNEQLKIYQQDLEEKIKERTHQLQLEKERAERADNLKTSFLENLSHEIRTPLNAIVGFSSLLGDSNNDNDTKKRHIKQIQTASDSLLRMIETILQASKIQVGEYEIDASKFRLMELVETLIEQTNTLLAEKPTIHFVLTMDKELREINLFFDKDALHHILLNFLENAVKYTKTGLIEFIITTNKAKQLLFFVNDTGIGIIENQIQNIFEPFQKIETKEELFRGMGVGLAISKGLADLIKAKIIVKSEVNKGSSFCLKLENTVLLV